MKCHNQGIYYVYILFSQQHWTILARVIYATLKGARSILGIRLQIKPHYTTLILFSTCI